MSRVLVAKTEAWSDGDRDDERSLIEAARRDPAAFGVLYRRHYRGVAGYLFRRVGDEHVAEDLAAETFVSAYRAIGRFRFTGVPLRAWLMRIATNKANGWARRERVRLGARPAGGGGDERADGDDLALLYRALRTLSVEHQSVVALVHFESMGVAETAATLGVREGTVKSRLSRARAALRREIERLGGGR